MIGTLQDITVDGSICIIVLDDANDKQCICYAETRLFMNAIDECYGEDWKGKVIKYEIDSINCMTAFQPYELCFND